MNLRHTLSLAPALLLGSLLVGDLARAQEKVVGPDLGQKLGLEESPQEEMKRLFHEVERTLESIDLELADAGAGEIPLGDGRESGIDKLLRGTVSKGQEAVDGIDRILELAQQMGGTCSSCMKPGGEKPSGESPLDKERQRGPSEGEKTPSAPKPEGAQPEGQQPKPQGKQPDDRGQNPPTGENRPGAPRTDQPGAAVSPVDDADRWGQLPERVQQVFRNQITDDLPLQYRDWIDSYYHRLNRSR